MKEGGGHGREERAWRSAAALIRSKLGPQIRSPSVNIQIPGPSPDLLNQHFQWEGLGIHVVSKPVALRLWPSPCTILVKWC